MPNQGASLRSDKDHDQYFTLDSLLFNFLRHQRLIGPIERAERMEETLSPDSFVLAREIEHWMFQTVEGKLWTSRRYGKNLSTSTQTSQ